MKKLKVLYISMEYPPYIWGGAGIYLYLLIKTLLRNYPDQIEISIFCPKGVTELGKGLPPLKVNIFPVSLSFQFFPARYLEFLVKANLFVRRKGKDFQIIHDNYNSIFFSPTSLVATVHTTQWHECQHSLFYYPSLLRIFPWLAYQFLWSFEKMCLSHADVLIVPTSYLKKTLSQIFPGKEIKVIPHGIDITFFSPRRESKIFDLIFAGRFVARKGIREFLDSLYFLHTPLKVLLAGYGKGRILQKIEKVKKETPHQLFVREIPWLDLPVFFSKTKLAVFPSHYESFGYTILETLSSGLPVLTTPVGIASGLRGKEIIPLPPQPEIIAEKVKFYLQNEEERGEANRRLREYFQKKFSLEKEAEETFKIYEKLSKN